jgi:CheY-like chemotaxis protein
LRLSASLPAPEAAVKSADDAAEDNTRRCPAISDPTNALEARILVVDDEEANVQLLESMPSVPPVDSYLPVLVLSADATSETRRRALAGGAKDFLTKPFDVNEVLLRIANMLDIHLLHLQPQE